jgi:DNA helicase-2/ATP-dependent DNA helicase PcrA
MPPSNKIIFASAGAGKTTEIVIDALAMRPRRAAITTFTLKNVDEIRRKLIETNGCVPPEITIYPWYTFVLHEMVRPYQGHVHAERVAGVHFAKGATRTYVQKKDVGRYYCDRENQAYSDRLADFALLCNQASGGKVLRRLNDMFSHIFVDEVQTWLHTTSMFLSSLFVRQSASRPSGTFVRQLSGQATRPRTNSISAEALS